MSLSNFAKNWAAVSPKEIERDAREYVKTYVKLDSKQHPQPSSVRAWQQYCPKPEHLSAFDSIVLGSAWHSAYADEVKKMGGCSYDAN